MLELDTCRMNPTLTSGSLLRYFDHIHVHRGLTKEDQHCENFGLLKKNQNYSIWENPMWRLNLGFLQSTLPNLPFNYYVKLLAQVVDHTVHITRTECHVLYTVAPHIFDSSCAALLKIYMNTFKLMDENTRSKSQPFPSLSNEVPLQVKH